VRGLGAGQGGVFEDLKALSFSFEEEVA